MANSLETWDAVVIIMYFILVISIGLLSMCRSNRGSAEGYFLAGGSMIWLPVGASLFASNIGSEHFIGLAGSGASSGIAVGAFTLNAIIILQLLGWIFLPVYLAGGVYTMPEYLHKRFGGHRIRMYMAVLALTLYIFTKISVDLFSGAMFIQQALDWSLYPSIMSLLAITAIYTVTGGLAAVIYTDTLQAFIMMGGAAVLCAMSFAKIGGYQELKSLYMQAVPNETLYENNTCGYPREDSFVMLRAAKGSDLPWAGFIFGQTTASLWYWATDQVIVQRALASKNLSHGQGATLFAALCKMTPFYFIVLPGMIARVLFPDKVACADPDVCMEVCGSKSGCSNLAYPMLVMNILPQGFRGLILAVMLSALTSSLTSIFNSSSTIFTMDIWRKLRRFPRDEVIRRMSPNKQRKYELELMIVGRVFILLLITLSVLWIPVVQNAQSGQLFHYIQEIAANLAPPISAVFTVSILWERINEPGAFWSLMVGLAAGFSRMMLDFTWKKPGCGEEDLRPPLVAALQFHYMYFALTLFLLTGVLAILFSLCTKPIPKECLYRLTFWTRFSQEERRSVDDWYATHSLKNDDSENELQDMLAVREVQKCPEMGENGKESYWDHIIIQGDEEGSIPQRCMNWFCGLANLDSQEEEVCKEQQREREFQQMQKIIQTKNEKILLNIGLVIVVAIGIFLYAWYANE